MEPSEYRRRAKKLDSPTSLTEFAPLSSDVKAKTGGFSLGRFFKLSRATRSGVTTDAAVPEVVPEDSACHSIPEDEVVEPQSPPSSGTGQNSPISGALTADSHPVPSSVDTRVTAAPESRGELDVLYTRSFSGVLSRIAHIMDRGVVAPNAYREADFKQYWMPDSNCRECYECGDKFTTFRRRHHCRICGQIFCSRCCNREIPGKIIGYRGDLRVCMYCCQVVLSYVKSLDLSADLRGVLSDLQNKLGMIRAEEEDCTSPDAGTWGMSGRRKTSLGFREEALVVPKADVEDYSPSDKAGFQSPSPGRTPVYDKMFIRELWSQIQHPTHGVSFQTHRHRLHSYSNCVVGNELVDWLVAQGKVSSRGEATSIGQALIDSNFLEPVVPHEPIFIDAYSLYKPGSDTQTDGGPSHPSSPPDEVVEENQDPLWVSEIQPAGSLSPFSVMDDSLEADKASVGHMGNPIPYKEKKRLTASTSTFFLNLDLKESRVTVSRPRDTLAVSPEEDEPEDARRSRWDSHRSAVNSEICNRTINDDCVSGALYASTSMHNLGLQKLVLDEATVSEVKESLSSTYAVLEKDLLNQLLAADGLPLPWAEVVLPIVHKVANTVTPDVKNLNDDMDIRQYVHIKKIPGGNRTECAVVSGVVCTKNVVHKKMRQQLTNPRILLVGSSIVYQRVENKLSSLDPILMQECEYLKHVVAKIQVFQPDLLLVEKTVSRLAQEKLLQMDVTLAINVKPSVMERVSRCTQSAIVSSIDAQLRKPNLGSCQNFFVKTYVLPSNRFKTLLFFDGCSSKLGCTILLRGGSGPELKKVKNIIRFMLYVAFNWRLEFAFLTDEHAQPPMQSEVAEDDMENEVEENGMIPDPDKGPLIMDQVGEPKVSVGSEDSTKKVEMSCVEDFSDPLHTLLNADEDDAALTEHRLSLKTQVLPLSNSFKLALDSTILCCSPFIRLTLPYLKTEAGRRCELRKFFSDEIYWSPKTCDTEEVWTKMEPDDSPLSALNAKNMQEKVVILPYHPFTFQKLSSSLWESAEAEALLADFRARGGRIQNLCQHNSGKAESSPGHSPTSGVSTEQHLWDGRIDALSPYNHQRVAVLFCSYSPTSSNAPYFCVNPWVISMDFYGRNDISLGGFLERYCFRSAYTCPNASCDTPMLEHVRKFVHENGCIQILLHHLDNPPTAAQNAIIMWSWCRKCRFVTPLTTMSDETWSLSFAKYLELRFHGNAYTCRSLHQQCQHSLHHDHYQYFASQQVVASFKYSPIAMREVALPPPVISIVDEIPQVSAVVDEIRDLALKGYWVYNTVVETLCSLRAQVQATKYEEFAADLMEMQQTEKNAFKEKIEDIQLQLTSPNLKMCQSQDPSTLDTSVLNEACSLTWKINDSLVSLKHYIADAVNCWNKRLQDFESVRKREEKLLNRSSQAKKPAPVHGADALSDDSAHKQELNESIDTASSLGDSDSAGDVDITDAHFGPEPQQCEKEAQDSLASPPDDSFSPPSGALRVSSSSSSVSSCLYGASPGIHAGLTGHECSTPKQDSCCQPQGLEDSTESRKSAAQRSHERSRSDGAERLLENRMKLSAASKADEDSQGGKQEKRGTVKTIISQLLSSSGSNPIQSPFPASDHFNVSHGARIPIVIYDQEPSSIIAHALASQDYEQKLLELQSTLTTALSQLREQPSPTAKLPAENPMVDFNDLALCSSQETDKRTGLKNPNMHIETQFSDATSQFYCRIFFAEQFRKLRCLIFPHGEDRFIHSLSRCVSWSAQGGKSGSSFCKTHDDRFILKQMSRYEVQSFLEFAPLYFQYVSSACTDRQPTVLAKIVGVFRIGYKNSATNAASKLDLLVMENLFYKRNIAQKFDLKGSVRNRLVNTRSQTEGDVVLLDENLLKTTCDSPLYVRPHSKTVLSLAIRNDANFLSDNSVMDYSLLVGFDNDRKELVVGIIDYIRTFTWDKKLEMVVKSTVTLRGHGKLPTIVWPNLYRVRFCEAMDKYFLCVPDHWSGLGRGVDC